VKNKSQRWKLGVASTLLSSLLAIPAAAQANGNSSSFSQPTKAACMIGRGPGETIVHCFEETRKDCTGTNQTKYQAWWIYSFSQMQ
jgi:hypothetical protein